MTVKLSKWWSYVLSNTCKTLLICKMCHYNLIFERIASAADYTSRLQGFRGLEFRSSPKYQMSPTNPTFVSPAHVTTQQMQRSNVWQFKVWHPFPNSKRIFSLELKWWCKCDKDSLKKGKSFFSATFYRFLRASALFKASKAFLWLHFWNV